MRDVKARFDFMSAVMLVLLPATVALADSAVTNKAKGWPYGPYDKLYPNPPVIEKSKPSVIIRTAPAEHKEIIIYRGTQPGAVDGVVTNAIVPPKLELRPK